MKNDRSQQSVDDLEDRIEDLEAQIEEILKSNPLVKKIQAPIRPSR